MWILVIIIQGFTPNAPISSFNTSLPSHIACEDAGETAKKTFEAKKVEYVCLEWEVSK